MARANLIRPLCAAGALSAWIGVFLQYAVVIRADIPVSLELRTVFFFSYFTILSNIFAGLSLTLPLVSPKTRAARFLDRSSVQAGIACYLIITGLVFLLVARHQIPMVVRHPVSDALLHYVTPVLFCIQWFLAGRGRPLRAMDPVIWLWFPTLFAAVVLGIGALIGFYPYPFLDLSIIGTLALVENMSGLALLFLVIGYLMVWIDRARRS